MILVKDDKAEFIWWGGIRIGIKINVMRLYNRGERLSSILNTRKSGNLRPRTGSVWAMDRKLIKRKHHEKGEILA